MVLCATARPTTVTFRVRRSMASSMFTTTALTTLSRATILEHGRRRAVRKKVAYSVERRLGRDDLRRRYTRALAVRELKFDLVARRILLLFAHDALLVEVLIEEDDGGTVRRHEHVHGGSIALRLESQGTIEKPLGAAPRLTSLYKPEVGNPSSANVGNPTLELGG
jgi:hypothetical protein